MQLPDGVPMMASNTVSLTDREEPAMSSIVTYSEGQPFAGVVGRTSGESTPAWPTPPRAQDGAPNVIIFVLDDVGFGQLSSFGGLVETPVIDRFADDGLRYTNMHTTALCSPSRGAILTGRNHHSLGLGVISEVSTGYPGYNGIMPFDKGMLSEMLLPHGYNTFMVGKWHLSPPEHETAAGPYDRWPLGRGFERFYGFLGGDTNQWYPDLVYDNHSVEQPRQPEDGYHLSADLADRAIEFIQDAHVNAPDKPFYLHYCTGAAHAPHHVPVEWADKYKGKFDAGWDDYREVVHHRQLDMGIIPAGTELSAHDPDVPVWETISESEKRVYARMMEVYAGFVSYTDHEFGRVVSFVEEIGELDNTFFILISDNGASSEGGPVGSLNEMMFFNNVPEDLEENLERIDELGGPTVFNHYAWGWTNAGNTPFRRWKRETYRGGCTDPCIVSWPARITARGEIRTQYAHIVDFVPTVLDALGIDPPITIRGVTQAPLEGVSFAHTFNDADAGTAHHTQYFEMFGHRSLYHDGWRAVCPWPGPSFAEAAEKGLRYGTPIDEAVLADIEANNWELYDLTKDYSETHDLAAENRPKLIEMIGRWWAEAGNYNVLPLDGAMLQRMNVERPTIAKSRDRFVYFPGGSPVPFTAAPKVYNRPFTITADVQIQDAAVHGVLIAQGGLTGGYSFFVKDNRLSFVYNFLGRDLFTVVSNVDVPSGDVSLRYEFEPTGEPDFAAGKGTPARGQLYIDDNLVGEVDMPHTVPNIFSTEGLTCGHDGGSRVAPDDYQDDFPFTGLLKRVTIDLSGTDLIPDSETDMKVAVARQ
ncbi:arylsulfatase [Cryobacterium sp. BB307]|uniref:arylsulfatase n=1 Tax=Cryobacterium sp. BB307 TaxID=2716317 RepID=UPI001B2FF4E1|nr:arylsulfatase [Cryobacterium sp. BB307]